MLVLSVKTPSNKWRNCRSPRPRCTLADIMPRLRCSGDPCFKTHCHGTPAVAARLKVLHKLCNVERTGAGLTSPTTNDSFVFALALDACCMQTPMKREVCGFVFSVRRLDPFLFPCLQRTLSPQKTIRAKHEGEQEDCSLRKLRMKMK